MAELLLEVGCEEIPAGFMPKALEDFKGIAERELKANRVNFEKIDAVGTPRRLALIASGVAARQEDLVLEKVGPAKSVAFDGDGKPTRAAQGFAKGQGVEVSELTVTVTGKGEYVCARKREQGKPTEEIFAQVLPRIIRSIPFPKTMRWGDSTLRFARPIHWIVAVFDGRVVPFKLENLTSSAETYGHRFMAPGPISVAGSADYRSRLGEAFVIVDPAERRERIEEVVGKAADEVSGCAGEDEALLMLITYLVEYPTAVVGSFDPQFLDLPREVLVACMKHHQMYFPVTGKDGKLLPHFVAVNNTRAPDPSVVTKGHERVLRARLSDAQFYFEDDRKVPLEGRVEELKGVTFQAKLGTSYEKMERFSKLAAFIAERVDPSLLAGVKRAALLCKADLVTGMVSEFPELQGVMGREYARLSGEKEEVATAIYEHYLPRFAGDVLPQCSVAAVVGMADRLDTIVGCFGVGLLPSGTADPYGLRRHALAVLNILLGRKYHLSLPELIDQAADGVSEKLTRPRDEVERDVLGFFRQRLFHQLTSQGYSHDVVDSVLSTVFIDPVDAVERVDALTNMKRERDFEHLAVAFKRVVNIVSDHGEEVVDPLLLKEKAEQELHRVYLAVERKVAGLVSVRDYAGALGEIVVLRGPIDCFFDEVLVMADDEALRKNRLALLKKLASLFMGIADFSKIVTEGA